MVIIRGLLWGILFQKLFHNLRNFIEFIINGRQNNWYYCLLLLLCLPFLVLKFLRQYYREFQGKRIDLNRPPFNIKMSLRRMIYPYSLFDKLALFPWKFHWDNAWGFKYTIVGGLATMPVFLKIQLATYAPANVRRYELSKEKDEKEHQMHLLHLS